MSDVKCPACKKDQEINHDGGDGYEEHVVYEQACEHCNETFKYRTGNRYAVFCGDEREHELAQDYPLEDDYWDCKNCDYVECRRDRSNEN